jgi:hypothetical protein
VTDSDSNNEVEPLSEFELQPDSPVAPADDAGGVDGQWVWQFASPPPPPSFLAVFFSGAALKELYRFFACGVLVVLGCLMPWGSAEEGVELVAGYETPLGAVSMVLGLWLVFSSCYGIYTRRQKILPVFLMIEPAIVTWVITMGIWNSPALQAEGFLGKLSMVFEKAGTGVMLTLLGSTWVALGFLFLLGKVYTKKDDKGATRRAAKGMVDKSDKNKSDNDSKKAEDDKDRDRDGAKDAPTDGDLAPEASAGEQTKTDGDAASTEGSSEKPAGAEARGASSGRGRRGRRR